MVAKSWWEQANAKVTELGTVVDMPGGQWAHNPFLSVLNKQAGIMRMASDELGFSPTARSRVKVSGKKKANAFSRLKQFKVD